MVTMGSSVIITIGKILQIALSADINRIFLPALSLKDVELHMRLIEFVCNAGILKKAKIVYARKTQVDKKEHAKKEPNIAPCANQSMNKIHRLKKYE